MTIVAKSRSRLQRGLTYVTGFQRWSARVSAAALLVVRRLGFSSHLEHALELNLSGRFVSDCGTFILRPNTSDFMVVHPGHEKMTRAWLEDFVSKNPVRVFIDVGAHCGSFAIPQAAHFDQVLAFEPFVDNYVALQANIELNKLQNKIHSIRAAVANEECIRTLFLNNDDTHSLMSSSNERSQTIEVNVVTLDNEIQRRQIPAADVALVKVDVEGAEVQVLEGARGLLTTGSAVLLLEANSPSETEMLERHLRPYGYQLQTVLDQRNLIFSK